MATPTTREQFSDYCLRRLGFPVIEINVAEEQVDDRIDDAITKYFDYHFDGVEEDYLIVPITNTDVTNGYITLDEKVFSVISALPVGNDVSTGVGSGDLFNAQYQFYMNDFYNTSNIIGNNLAYLDSMKSYLATMQMSLSPLNSFNFNRKTNRIRFNEPLSLLKEKTSNIVLKIYKKLDINTFNDIWADEFLKEYATALIKRQWGENLKKFGNMNLPGGITINGDAIYSEAITEIEKLETRLTKDLQLPLDLFIG
jgi:hypothetical protein